MADKPKWARQAHYMMIEADKVSISKEEVKTAMSTISVSYLLIDLLAISNLTRIIWRKKKKKDLPIHRNGFFFVLISSFVRKILELFNVFNIL